MTVRTLGFRSAHEFEARNRPSRALAVFNSNFHSRRISALNGRPRGEFAIHFEMPISFCNGCVLSQRRRGAATFSVKAAVSESIGVSASSNDDQSEIRGPCNRTDRSLLSFISPAAAAINNGR